MLKTREDLNQYLKEDYSKRFSGGGGLESILLSVLYGNLTYISGKRSIT